MESGINFFIFQLAIIFLPGLIWERVATKYGPAHKPESFEVIIRTFTFGLTSYMITFALYWFFGADFLFPNLQSDGTALDAKYLREYAVTLAVAAFCSLLWLYAVNNGLLGRFLGKVRATKRISPHDIWDQVFNSRQAFAEYVYVRDYDKGLVFSGWVQAFSESEEERELLLRDVQVFDFDKKLLYSMPHLYIGRASNNIDIEFPVDGKPTTSRKSKKTKKAKGRRSKRK